MAKFDSKLREDLVLTSNLSAAVDGETYVSRDSGSHIPPPPPLYKWQLPGFFDGVEDDEVDTTLSLRTPGSNNTNKSTGKTSEPQTSAAAHTPRWNLPSFFDGLEEDEVDTTLSLRPPGSTNNKSTKPPEKASRPEEAAETSARNIRPPPVVINAVPLRCALPALADHPVEASVHIPPVVEINATPLRNKKIRKSSGDKSRINKRRRNEEDERPPIPSQGLLRAVELQSGSVPEFLYRKRLEKCDVSRHHNRLLVTGSERLIGFLREEEAAAVLDGSGLTLVGVDGGGNVYDNLAMKKWASLNTVVINSGWKEVVAKNNAQKGDVVEIWGYRSTENANSCLGFQFRERGDN
ncbi:uncharacterized protein LOC131023651 [Salvia miltiorrhiza]|uniref:uncharacterized protein LOC131023651 n=1 Tax=Salvia miltiorrhiza TaxID=226208 RepID=UPI0025ABEE69|nr:uncharacterized protein LOC131023651 [Salvia miltiorrhiza]